MFPSKSTVDYMNEIRRLFPIDQPIESRNMAQKYNSPFQTAPANKSSSSADSISPESYFDIPFYNREADQYLTRNRCETPKPTYFGSPMSYENPKNVFGSSQNICPNSPKSIYGSPDVNMSPKNIFERQGLHESPKMYESIFDSLHGRDVPNYINYHSNNPETPLPIRRQRPIVGRKILGSSQQAQRSENEFDAWQFEALPPTPPERSQKRYELFPSQERSLHLSTPIKVIKPPSFDTSSITSYSSSNYIQNPYNPRQTNSQYSSSSIDGIGPTKMCTFCRKNGETPVVYMTHCVKEKIGNRQVVTCPILRSHECSTCGASGDDAHTITYCPVLRRSNNGKPLQSTTVTLKNTRLKSNGRRRY